MLFKDELHEYLATTTRMKYIEGHLLPDEKMVYATKLHWIIWAPTVIVGLIALSLMGGTGAWILVIPALIGLSTFLTYISSEFGITNKRVIMKMGFIRRRSLELLLSKIESIQVDQGILGRMLDYGTIGVSGTGGSKTPFPSVVKPMEFRSKVNELLV